MVSFSNFVELWFTKCFTFSRRYSCRNSVFIVYNYQINSIDGDGDEGANSPDLAVETDPEVPTPIIAAIGDVNAVRFEVSEPSLIASFYKVFSSNEKNFILVIN